jgi:hypothetical protein
MPDKRLRWLAITSSTADISFFNCVRAAATDFCDVPIEEVLLATAPLTFKNAFTSPVRAG